MQIKLELLKQNKLWVAIPVEQRKQYMAALERASTEQTIQDFCDLLAQFFRTS